MSWLTHWVRTTFDYNPTFPLSALVVLGGLRLLAAEGALDGSTVAGASGALGILGAYELLLLGVALLVLWPRRIAYETTAILIIFAVVRFASPFAVISLASEGEPFAACLLGLVLTAAMIGKGEAIHRRVGLDLAPWERAFDYALFGLACVAFPLAGERLSAWTGDAISHQSGRLLQVGLWWTLALGLIPLSRGLTGLGADGPLRSRRPALVWRWLTAVGSATLLFSALWLGGSTPFLLAVAPLALLGLTLLRTSLLATGRALPRWILYAPAAFAGAAVVLPARTLFGGLPVVSHPAAVLGLVVLAAAFVPVLTRPGERLLGLRGVAGVLAFAPLRFAPSLPHAQTYVLACALGLLALGLVRRRDGLCAGAAAAAGLAGGTLALRWIGPEPTLQLTLACGSLFALVAAWRLPRREGLSPSLVVAGGLCALPALVVAFGSSSLVSAGVAGGAGLALAGAAWIQGSRAIRRLGVGQAALILGQRLTTQVAPGVALIAIGFLAVPAGTALALRRERRERTREPVVAESAEPSIAAQGVAA